MDVRDGYFPHIDYATMRPDCNANPANNYKKNWNSVGDHIPAYLVNLLIALDPLAPDAREDLHCPRKERSVVHASRGGGAG